MKVAEQVEVKETSEVAELDNLESAIVEDKPDFDMPDKFKGKSPEEIAQSYINLESESGRQRNEIGELRKSVDELLDLNKKPEPVRQAVDVDTLLDDPDRAITSAIEGSEKLNAIEQKLQAQEIQQAQSKFEAKHKDWQKTVSSQEFLTWVNKTPVRQRMFETAHKDYNYDYADELLTNFEEINSAKIAQTQEQRELKKQSDLKAATTETGVGGAAKRKIYRRTDLINMRINDPESYQAKEAEIRQAYAEGRVK